MQAVNITNPETFERIAWTFNVAQNTRKEKPRCYGNPEQQTLFTFCMRGGDGIQNDHGHCCTIEVCKPEAMFWHLPTFESRTPCSGYCDYLCFVDEFSFCALRVSIYMSNVSWHSPFRTCEYSRSRLSPICISCAQVISRCLGVSVSLDSTRIEIRFRRNHFLNSTSMEPTGRHGTHWKDVSLEGEHVSFRVLFLANMYILYMIVWSWYHVCFSSICGCHSGFVAASLHPHIYVFGSCHTIIFQHPWNGFSVWTAPMFVSKCSAIIKLPSCRR